MVKYKPNFKDPRTIKRIRTALSFVEKTFRFEDSEIYLSKSTIDRKEHLGHSGNQLGRYLRNLLLICINENYSSLGERKISKRYKSNLNGVRYLTEVLDNSYTGSYRDYLDTNNTQQQQTHNSVIHLREKQAQTLFDQYQDQITTGDFVMKTHGNREYHALQNIPRDIRARKFAEKGYCYDYDIETAAPTLLLQRAKMPPSITEPNKRQLTKPTLVIDYFLENKVEIRNIIAQDCGIDYNQAKKVITALFQGAILSCWHTNRIYRDTLNYNTIALEALKAHPLILALREEIRLMWNVLDHDFERSTYRDKNGITKTKRISGKQKVNKYQELELEIMTQVKRYMRDQISVRFISEHDGWKTTSPIDVFELRQLIKQRTGYVINIDYSKYELGDTNNTTTATNT